MRKFLPFIALILLSTGIRSQITLDNTYTKPVAFAYLEGNNYYSIDYINNQCTIYGLDYALKQKINIDVPSSDWYLNDVSFVSTHVFNNDDQIELLAVFYKYVTDTDTSGHYEYTTRVVSESGAVLLDIPGGGFSSIFTTGEGKRKLLVYVYDFSTYLYITQSNIYSLPDEAGASVNEIGGLILKEAYPNPTNSDVHIPYRMNSLTGNTMVIITNMKGQEMKRIPLNNQSGELTIQTDNLPAGQYIYYLQGNGHRTAARKLIVR